MAVITLLSFINFSKNILSVLLEKAVEALLTIIVYLYSKIEQRMILLINLTIFKVYFIFDCSQSCIFDNW